MTDGALSILYSFRRCPYAMRARMAIAASGERCEFREVVLRDKPPAMLEASTKGTVPVLVLPDGKVIDESLAVMRWALGRNDPENWFTPYTDEMAALIEDNDGPFKHHLDRYKYSSRYDGADPTEHRTQCETFLTKLNARLNRRKFLFGGEASFADIAIFPFMRQFRIADPDWFDAAPYPGLKGWLQRCVDLPVFTKIMTKHEPWAPGDAVTLFP